jgi:apolipoprotein D and lipocalin family protein
MRSLFFIFSLFLSIYAEAQLNTVPYVDLAQYAGRWYQIARNPLVFEGDCYCSQQTLTAQSDGRVGVFNSCNKGSITGPLDTISGFATSLDPVSNAKFEVDFGFPFKGQYWIIALDSTYRYAVVSEPTKKALYILSKTPILEQALIDVALEQAAHQVDTSQLLFTAQQDCTYPPQ